MSTDVECDTNSAPTSIETTCLPPVEPLQNAKTNSGVPESSPIYEGFTFFKADAMPNQTPTWTCVERTNMYLSQEDYFKMVQKRANKRSAAQQYENLTSHTRRAHIDRLIDEQRRNKPLVEWSCVYAKETTKPSKARNARREDYETVYMVVIIMQRPIKSSTHARSPMGDIVDLGKPFHPEAKHPSIWSHSVPQPLMPSQTGNKMWPISQGPPFQLASAPNPGAGKRVSLRELTQSTTAINNTPASPALSTTNSNNIDFEDSSSSSCGSSSDSDDPSVRFDESDETCATEDSDDIETETEDYMPRPNRAFLRQPVSPHRRETNSRSSSRHGVQSRTLDRRNERDYPPHGRFEATLIKSSGLKRTEGARSRGSVSGTRYQQQLMDDNKARSLMLDFREASIGQREKRLKRTFSEALEFDRRQSAKDKAPVCRCTCRCAIKKREGA